MRSSLASIFLITPDEQIDGGSFSPRKWRIFFFFILNPNQDLLTFARHLTDAGGSGHYGLASLKTVGGNFTGPAVFFGILETTDL